MISLVFDSNTFQRRSIKVWRQVIGIRRLKVNGFIVIRQHPVLDDEFEGAIRYYLLLRRRIRQDYARRARATNSRRHDESRTTSGNNLAIFDDSTSVAQVYQTRRRAHRSPLLGKTPEYSRTGRQAAGLACSSAISRQHPSAKVGCSTDTATGAAVQKVDIIDEEQTFTADQTGLTNNGHREDLTDALALRSGMMPLRWSKRDWQNKSCLIPCFQRLAILALCRRQGRHGRPSAAAACATQRWLGGNERSSATQADRCPASSSCATAPICAQACSRRSASNSTFKTLSRTSGD